MIARTVEKDMDEHSIGSIERLDRFQKLYRRGGVNGQGLNHLGLAGLQIDRAVCVDALTPARLLDRELLLARRLSTGTSHPRRHEFAGKNPSAREAISRAGLAEALKPCCHVVG
jgi:hypothetical protein